MLTDEEAAQIETAHAALPGTQPDCFSSTNVSEITDQKAWLEGQIERWKPEGMTYFRATLDGDTLWLEGWRMRPEKEAPFVGWYTASKPQTPTQEGR